MKTTVENILIGLLIAFAVAFVGFISWMMWMKTGDPYITAAAAIMMVWFFYLSPSIRMEKKTGRKPALAMPVNGNGVDLAHQAAGKTGNK